MNKVRVIERSLRCFVFGLFGLVPVLGMGLAFVAFYHFYKIRTEVADEWNPAKKYLNWGFTMAGWGLLGSLLLFTALMIHLIA